MITFLHSAYRCPQSVTQLTKAPRIQYDSATIAWAVVLDERHDLPLITAISILALKQSKEFYMLKLNFVSKLCSLAFTTVVFFTANANAALVHNIETLPGNFSRNIIVDTTNHQQWLEGWDTLGLTYNQVTNQLASGGAFQGYHVATTNDFLNLFSSAGLNNELSQDQWGGFNAHYTGSQQNTFSSFLHLMGLPTFSSAYFAFDNGNPNSFPILSANAFYGEIMTVANLPNAYKDSLIPLGWGVSTLLVKNSTPVAEPASLILALIALAGLISVRRLKLN